MNKPSFHVQVVSYEKINEIEDAWTKSDFKNLLSAMEFEADDNGSGNELRELCVMCLQDRPSVEAAEIVLKHRLQNKLSIGQIKNAAVELADEKLWEQFADLSVHEELFHVGSLMFAAFPGLYFEPDAIRLSVAITSKNQAAAEILKHPLEESALVRLLADGMSDDSILHRLFEDQLAGNSFPEANSVVWIFDFNEKDGNTLSGTIISSAHWLDSLEHVDEYESQAISDAKPLNHSP